MLASSSPVLLGRFRISRGVAKADDSRATDCTARDRSAKFVKNAIFSQDPFCVLVYTRRRRRHVCFQPENERHRYARVS